MKFFVGLALVALPWFAHAGVVINEIAWMGTDISATDEWVELFNEGSEVVDLGGWMLVAEDGSPTIALSGTIAANGYFLLERSDDETVPGITADVVYTGALGNSGEKLELRNANGIVIDMVDASPPAGGWPAGDNETKETMQRLSAGNWTTDTGTPKQPTSDVSPSSASVDSSSTSDVQKIDAPGASIGGEQVYMPKKSFVVDAGENIRTVAGAEVRFSGAAYGESGEPLDSSYARYLWNFGDGTFFEAQNANHIYRYPGIYRAALYASSGQTSGSDVVEVIVEENQVRISEIALEWIELFNNGAYAIDVSKWQIVNSAGGNYVFPAHTTIGPKALIVLPQEVSGIVFGPLNPKAELRYANGKAADEISFAGMMPAEKSVVRDEKGEMVLGEKTPGRTNKITKIQETTRLAARQVTKQISITKAPMAKTQNTETRTQTETKNTETENKNLLNAKRYPLNAQVQHISIFASNYFWLAISISIGLLAGAVVLALRHMIR